VGASGGRTDMKDIKVDLYYRIIFVFAILFITFTLIKSSRIEGYLFYLILLISALPLANEMYIFLTNTKTNLKKSINLNSREFLKNAIQIRNVVLLIAIVFIFQSPVYLPHIMKYPMEEYAQSEATKSDLDELVKNLTFDFSDDTNKTKAILRWFDRDSKNIHFILDRNNPLIKIYPLHIYASKPYICIRIIGHENPLWILKSRCGACDEYAMFFMEMANAANLSVRSIHNHGEDHNWDEVLIDGKWIVIDSSSVHLKNNQDGFNKSRRSFERSFNISHMYALYPNGTTEDVTFRYTNLSNLTIIVIDKNKKPVPDVSIQVISNNRYPKNGRDTEISCITDSEGVCNIKIGGGNYTIMGDKKDNGYYFSAENTITLVENENINTQLMLRKNYFRWLQDIPAYLFIFLLCLELWLIILLYEYTKNYIVE